MKYNTSVITYFVIPSGATSGQRVVLDGVLGEIDLYNAANQLVGQWKPSQFGIFAGSPNVGHSITIQPNDAGNSSRPTIRFGVTVSGSTSSVDATDDGTGRANLHLFSPPYANVSAISVNTSVQTATGFGGLITIDPSGNLRGGQFTILDGAATVACYQTAGVSPVALSTVVCNNLATPQVLITPDNTKVPAKKTLTAQYITSAGAAVFLSDTTWQGFTLFNGWFGAVSPNVPFYRLMPDGTVQFIGLLTKASAPVNGEQVLSVAAGYFPTGNAAFSAHSNLTVSGSQKIIIDNAGAGRIFDSPAGNGTAYLSEIRYPVL